MCNPGRGEDISQWTGNPHMVEERWKAMFSGPLQHLFESVLGGGTAAKSPIMEDIQSVTVTRLGTRELIDKKIPRKLIVVSDLLQFANGYSQYQPLESFARFKATPYYQGVRADMSGIDVEFWYVRRQSTLHLQGDRHIDFWRAYIGDQGGKVTNVWDVPGL